MTILNPQRANPADAAFIRGLPVDDLLPWHIDLNPTTYSYSASAGTWLVTTGAAYVNNAAIYNSSGAAADWIGWDVVLAAGTWQASVLYSAQNNAGQFTFQTDNGTGNYVNLGSTVDTYAVGTGTLTLTQQTLAITVTGKQRLRVIVQGKNASSSNYFVLLETLALQRVA